jgi:hypothetical protein
MKVWQKLARLMMAACVLSILSTPAWGYLRIHLP